MDPQLLRAWFNEAEPLKDGVVTLEALTNVLTAAGLCERQEVRRCIVQMVQWAATHGRPEELDLKLTFHDLAMLLGRATVAWTCYRVLVLTTDAHTGLSVATSWAQLQRKIVVSLLVNARFWGVHESQRVLASLDRQGPESDQYWSSLFQRVRAEGMAAALDEARHVAVVRQDKLAKREEAKKAPRVLGAVAAALEQQDADEVAASYLEEAGWDPALALEHIRQLQVDPSPPKPKPPARFVDCLAVYSAATKVPDPGEEQNA